MAQWHGKSKKRISGGRRTSRKSSGKKLSQKGSNPTETRLGPEKKRAIRGRGGKKRTLRLIATQNAVVFDKKAQKHTKAEIVSVTENASNRNYTRQNIITKGAKIKVSINGTEAEAVVTSRPGQSGEVQAVLLA